MDATQHDRGWDLSIREGHHQRRAGESGAQRKITKDKKEPATKSAKEPFHYPTPPGSDEEGSCRANKPPEQKEGTERRKKKKKKRRSREEAEEPKDTTPLVAIKVSTEQALPVDGQWRHIFFTYDGSGQRLGRKDLHQRQAG